MHEIGVDGKQKMTFVQFTIISPAKHEKNNGIKTSIEEGLVAQIISDIDGIGVKTCIDSKEHSIKMDVDSSLLHVEFVIFRWEKKKKYRHSNNVFDNILDVNCEQLEKRLPQYVGK